MAPKRRKNNANQHDAGDTDTPSVTTSSSGKTERIKPQVNRTASKELSIHFL